MYQLQVIDITKIYHVGSEEIKAVDHVMLQVEKGEFLSIVGHSGSGKTTLLSLIGGILRPTSGRVLFEGIDICSMNDDHLSKYRNKRVGFIFQFASLIPSLTVKENVLLPSIFSADRKQEINKNAEVLIEMVGLGDKKDKYPAQLSGGQQRRVAIARALVNEPDLILADEPTGDLDEETEREIMGLFKEINEQKKVTIILITHSPDLAQQAKRHLRMSKGRLLDIQQEVE
jgi:putative ABC transport system ATP-binding protein/lipoprotein-releasing system ATP-binding protein